MLAFFGWLGIGRGYDRPDASDVKKTAIDYGRQDTNPTAAFRFKRTCASIFAPGARNTGDAQTAEKASGQGSFVTSKPPQATGSA